MRYLLLFWLMLGSLWNYGQNCYDEESYNKSRELIYEGDNLSDLKNIEKANQKYEESKKYEERN